MSVFTNQNFISQIIKQEGASDCFDNDSLLILQALIQAQTSKMVEKASKHMHCDRRDTINSDDIQNAIKQMGHQQICHYKRDDKYVENNSQYLLKDSLFRDFSAFIQDELKTLTSFSMPNLKGRYIYINNKIPKINQNHQLKSLQDIKLIKVHQSQQKKKIFNIIRDQPQSQLTKEQVDYYNQIVTFLTSNNGNKQSQSISQAEQLEIQVSGSILNVLPLILKFIINLGVNQNSISFILKAIENKYVWSSIEYNMNQILIILVAYEGKQSFQVGCKIGHIVNKFCEKYYNLYDIFQNIPNTYPNISKKVGFEIVTGIPLRISLGKIKQIQLDSSKNNEQALICMKTLIDNWSSIRCLRQKSICQEYGYIYWYGSKQLQGDPYLNMY